MKRSHSTGHGTPRPGRQGQGLPPDTVFRRVFPLTQGRPRTYFWQAERDEREEFAAEACYAMRDRFQAEEVWENLGLPVDECARYMLESGFMAHYRTNLFTRIVPTMKAIGLWGSKIQDAYNQMGILGYGDVDVQAMSDQDERIAEDYDARKAEVQRVAEAGRAVS